MSTSNLGPVVFLSALENSKGETCFLLRCYKGSFFLWFGLAIRPLARQLTTIKHMLLIICEEHWSFLRPLLGPQTSLQAEPRSWFRASVRFSLYYASDGLFCCRLFSIICPLVHFNGEDS